MEFKEFTGKNVEDAVVNALVELELVRENLQYEVIEEGRGGILGIGSKPAIIKAKRKDSVKDIAFNFLTKTFAAMDLAVKINIEIDEENGFVNIDLIGDDMGILIGKRGQTLDSLQYLVSLVVNKESEKYLKVKLDTENYRERRRATLENLAKNISQKVKRTKKAVALEPMNPYERRIIHSVLQSDKFVTTKSEGEEPYRHVVVLVKR